MADHKDFLLPDLGEGLTEGEVVRWLVGVGDPIEIDQPVVEVETEKAVVEVPSPFDGKVMTLHAEVGDEVEVGQPLMTVDLRTGASDAAASGEDADSDAGSAQPAGPRTKAAGTVPGEAEVGDMVPEPSATADADAGSEDSGSVLVGYGTGRSRGRRRRGSAPITGGATPVTGAPPGTPRHEATRPTPTTGEGRPLAKPPVRKLAKDLGVDLADVPGSGPDGLITRDDVEAYATAASATSAAQVTPAPKVGPPSARAEEPGAAAVRPPQAPGPAVVERVPLRGIRKRIAERMTVSRREVPEATAWVDVDATRLIRLRDNLNADQSDIRVSPLAIVMRAVVAGLREHPQVNSRLDTGTNEIVVQRFVHLGFAAQTERGLLVPVIKDAHARSTLSIAAELNRLAAAARDGTAKPEELIGGTFTVSNYGSFGIDGGGAIINYPEAAILGVGRIADKPWVVDGELAVRKVVQLSIAFDHRICDGGEAGGFLRFVADCVESPTKLLASL